MKTPETVTLIDLQGKPITNPLTTREALASLQVWVSYEEIEGEDELVETVAVLNSSPYLIATVKGECKSIFKLLDFLNDQLTFIRNGLWETLAIYQSTLGRWC